MWKAHCENLSGTSELKYTLVENGSPLTYQQVLKLWQSSAEFRRFFNTLLADCPYDAFRWETPPLNKKLLNRTFEFVLLNSPALIVEADPLAFASHFQNNPAELVLEFPNLGGDAHLIVPRPIDGHSSYPHIAAFVRTAPECQWHALWELVGKAMELRTSDRPVWLNTAGAGVAWLHVRLDDRPKYYCYSPYRTRI